MLKLNANALKLSKNVIYSLKNKTNFNNTRALSHNVSALCRNNNVISQPSINSPILNTSRVIGVSRFSTNEKPTPEKAEEVQEEVKKEVTRFDPDDYDDYDQQPKTLGQQGMQLVQIAFIFAVFVMMLYGVYELFPGRQSPQYLFSEVGDMLRDRDDILAVTGESPTAYGRDVGRNEGRRNHVDSRQYKAEDGSSRTRIRFSMKGPKGHIHVYAEVSDKMKSDEFVYVIAKNVKTHKVITVIDNRDRIEVRYVSYVCIYIYI